MLNYCEDCKTFLSLIFFDQEKKYFCFDCIKTNIKTKQTILFNKPKWLPQVDGYLGIPKPLPLHYNEDYYQTYLNNTPNDNLYFPTHRCRKEKKMILKEQETEKLERNIYLANYYQNNKKKIDDQRRLKNLNIKSLTLNSYIKLLEKEKYEIPEEDTNVLDITKHYKDIITF